VAFLLDDFAVWQTREKRCQLPLLLFLKDYLYSRNVVNDQFILRTGNRPLRPKIIEQAVLRLKEFTRQAQSGAFPGESRAAEPAHPRGHRHAFGS
jgi:hypothetical protein